MFLLDIRYLISGEEKEQFSEQVEIPASLQDVLVSQEHCHNSSSSLQGATQPEKPNQVRTRLAWSPAFFFQTQGLVLLPFSYLVMPYMRTDLQKIMGHEFSDEKIQYLVYQMLKGLKVGGSGGV